ncbi:N6-adenosine-methyltransferase catalytic subunit [Lamellibrachia satsuma]|nr:N6-adenosine-methyltransferase catalytic subunit [Lamellibrachia satsuma]
MSDTWSDIQALKTKHSSLREKIAQRKKKREEIAAGILGLTTTAGATHAESPGATASSSSQPSTVVTTAQTNEPARSKSPPWKDLAKASPEFTANVEQKLLLLLGDVTLSLPCDVHSVTDSLSKGMHAHIALTLVEDLLHKFTAQALIRKTCFPGHSAVQVDSVDLGKLSAVSGEPEPECSTEAKSRKRRKSGGASDEPCGKKQQQKPQGHDGANDSVESLLSMQSAKEKENKKLNEEILQLLSKPTAKELSLVEKFRSQGGAQVKEFCAFGTRMECLRTNTNKQCDKLHFRKIIHKHTDESLGDCSFLNTCFHMDTCKYVHYEVEHADRRSRLSARLDVSKPEGGVKKKIQEGSTTLFPPQWVKCDLRNFEMSVLGKFTVIMADPPWDIHMELPYGTMSDDEMRQLNVPILQDDGYIFLWVTGRSAICAVCINNPQRIF